MKTLSILYADDDENDQFIFGRVVEKIGREIDLHMVDDGMGAIEYLSGHGRYADRNRYPLPQLVISDVKMPRVSGIGLLRWIRQQNTLSAMPVVMLSSSGLENDIRSAHQLGANGYVVKSLSLGELGDCVRDMLTLCGQGQSQPQGWLAFPGNQPLPTPVQTTRPTPIRSLTDPLHVLRGTAARSFVTQW